MKRLAILLILLAANARGATIRIETEINEPVTITAGNESCTLESSCTLTIAKDVDIVTVRRGDRVQEMHVVDIAPLLDPLRDRTKRFGMRVRGFLDARAKFEKKWPALDDESAFVMAMDAHSLPEIEAAQNRLRFDLPAEYVQLLTNVGAFQIEDASFTKPEDLTNAYDAVRAQWHLDSATLDALPKNIVRLLRESTVLFQDDDEQSALLYQPKSADCNGGPAYYFAQREMLESQPNLVSCNDFTHATTWLFRDYAVAPYENAGAEYLLIDSNSDPMFVTRLIVEDDTLRFSAPW